jgi:hypothetical protein
VPARLIAGHGLVASTDRGLIEDLDPDEAPPTALADPANDC